MGLGNGDSSKSNNSSKEKEKEQLQLLAEYFGRCITQPAFPSLLNSALEQPLRSNSTRSTQHQLKSNSAFITNFCRFLRLSRSQEVVLRIALLETFNTEARSQSILVIRQKLGELLKNFADQDRNTAPFEGGLQVFFISSSSFFFVSNAIIYEFQESSPEVIHYILSRLLNEDDKFGISKDLLEDVLSCLRRDYPRELVPVILAPILYKEQGLEYTCHKMAHESSTLTKKNMVESSLADLILETGYSFTSSLEECRTHFTAFGLRDLSAALVARAISYMTRTHTGLDEHSLRHLRNGTSQAWPEQETIGDKSDDGPPTSWNMEIFVQVRKLAATADASCNILLFFFFFLL